MKNITLRLDILESHPWIKESKNGLFLVPTKFLFDISNPNSTSTTDMGDGSGKQYNQKVIWDNIKKHGMRDPFYVIISIPNPNDKAGEATIRLESGNHRIKEALLDGLTHLPVAAFIQSRSLYHKGNGTHKFKLDKNQVYNYYKSINRDPSYFDPYPHPVDLKNVLSHLDIYTTKNINIIKNKNGLIEFTKDKN